MIANLAVPPGNRVLDAGCGVGWATRLFAVQLKWLPSFGAKSGLHLILPMESMERCHV